LFKNNEITYFFYGISSSVVLPNFTIACSLC